MVADAPATSTIGGVDASVALNAPALTPDTDAPLIVMGGSPVAPRLVSVTVLVAVDPVVVAGKLTLVGENPNWLGLLPAWSTSIALMEGFSTTWVKVTVMAGSVVVVVTGKVLTTPLRAPTSATVS